MKKPNPRQTSFLLPEAEMKTEPTFHDVDYTAMDLGQSAGQRKVIRKCDICGKHAIERHNDAFFIWIHAETLKLDAKNNVRRQTTRQCKKPRFNNAPP